MRHHKKNSTANLSKQLTPTVGGPAWRQAQQEKLKALDEKTAEIRRKSAAANGKYSKIPPEKLAHIAALADKLYNEKRPDSLINTPRQRDTRSAPTPSESSKPAEVNLAYESPALSK